jgi:hypothetical protein
MTLTGVFDLETLSLYNTENGYSLILRNIFSTKGFGNNFSRNFFYPFCKIKKNTVVKIYLVIDV